MPQKIQMIQILIYLKEIASKSFKKLHIRMNLKEIPSKIPNNTYLDKSERNPLKNPNNTDSDKSERNCLQKYPNNT